MVLYVVLGLAFLAGGGEALVRGAASLARRLGVSALVVGLTVVAFGTSAPELMVSVLAALEGRSDLSVSNVVGSNIFNVLFILGASALITPLVVARQLNQLDVPVMIGASLLLWLMSLDGRVGLFDASVLLAAAAFYTVVTVRAGRKAPDAGEEASTPVTKSGWVDAALIGFGLLALVIGARLLVSGAVSVAEALGVSEAIIGLTIVAAGTSLPELVTSIVAGFRKQPDIAVGNVVGSNIFNILGILGISGLLCGGDLTVGAGLRALDIPVMVAVAVACLPIFLIGHRISRIAGGLLFGHYVAYSLYLVLAALHHELLEPFNQAMLGFVLPLTVLTLAVLSYRAAQAARP
ncbi:MAG: calcium/sodium antiporter [Deltaproteobacteria bacterium]|nr:calcium/sodium antiporter [Deltaproteobacteria bacterium]